MKGILATLSFASALVFGAIPSALGENKQNASAADADLQALVRGNNEFALDLYRQLSQKTDGNIFFSPFSISTALAMTYAGARGQTAEQMAKTLHFTLEQKRLHPTFAKMLRDLPERVQAANALWGQRGWPFHKGFLQIAKDDYKAPFEETDFQTAPEAARNVVNRWVQEQTKGKVQEVLGPEDIDSRTNLILANAIYFKDRWEFVFPPEKTKRAEFHIIPSKILDVPMMQLDKGTFNCWESEDFQMVELPYKGKSLAMVIVLANKKASKPAFADKKATKPPALANKKASKPSGSVAGWPLATAPGSNDDHRGWLPDLKALEKSLDAARFENAMVLLQRRRAEAVVYLPRFEITCAWRLAKELEQLGMPLAFRGDADFSGISSARSFVREVHHQAYIQVNEEGTTAAAATAVRTWNTSFGLPFVFRADRPFLFFIRDTQTGTVLFMGRVVNPV